MNSWKVILATLVIFGAGVFTGVLVIKKPTPPPVIVPPPSVRPPSVDAQRRLQDRMKREMQLSPEQTEKLEKIFTESRERIKIIWNLLGPELQTEHRKVLEEIRAELNDQQKKKLEELLKQTRRGNPNTPGGGRHPSGEHRPGGPPFNTNSRPANPGDETPPNPTSVRPSPPDS